MSRASRSCLTPNNLPGFPPGKSFLVVLSHHSHPLFAHAVVRAVRHSLVPVTTALTLAESHPRLTLRLVGRALCGDAAFLRLYEGARGFPEDRLGARSVVVAAPGSTGGEHLPSPVPVFRAVGSGNASSASDATAASPQGLGDDTHGGFDAADKVTGVAGCGHTDGGDHVPGRGYSVTTFRVASCVHPNRKVVPGSKVYACLGRNVYVLWSSSRRGVPTTVDAFRAAGPSCIVLERGAGALRVPSEEECAAVGGLHTNRLLFLEGKERNSIFSGQDLLDVQLLLEAPSAAICSSWVTGGGSLLTPWEALVCASLSGWNDATAVHELLMSVLPPLPEAADHQPGIASKILGRRGRHFVLNAQHWLAPSASAGLTGASTIGKAADAVDQVTCVPVVGPVLRLCLLVVQVGVLVVLADGHDARRKDAVERCEAIAFDVLCRIFEQLRTDPTEFGAACATASQWSRRGLAVVVPRPFNLNIDLPA